MHTHGLLISAMLLATGTRLVCSAELHLWNFSELTLKAEAAGGRSCGNYDPIVLWVGVCDHQLQVP